MTIRWLLGRSPNEPVARCGLGATIVILAAMPGMFYAVRVSAEGIHTPRADPAAVRSATHSGSHPVTHPVAHPRQDQSAAPQATASYVSSAACSRCHADIYNHYVRTRMGHSMTPVTADFLNTVPLSASVYDKQLDRHYEVASRDGKLYQSEFKSSPDGKEIFRNTQEIQWIVGANLNGLGAIVQHDDYLFEAPLSYYDKTGQWQLSPGYQRADIGFSRTIAPGCIFCHSGRAQPVANQDGKYQNPAFSQLAIGCENCHGPGSAHVEAMSEGESWDKGKDPTIVNPEHLTARLSDDLCMSCHQTGDTRVFQPGKSYSDYRPGTPLDRVMAILMVPPTRDNPPQEDHVEHYYSMILSKCYRGSQASTNPMRCITCHDPHEEPTAAEAPAFFNAKCLTCHAEGSPSSHSNRSAAPVCTAAAPIRRTASDNCIRCHMPKRDNIAISHSSLTNHRIVARPDEPFPDVAFQMTTAAMPDLIHLNAVPGEHLPKITLLQAYSQLRTQSPAYDHAYAEVLTELEKSEPDHAIVQAALGHQDLINGQPQAALDHLQAALRLNPAQASVYADLSAIADSQGRAADAVNLQQSAVDLEPFSAPLQKTLVLRLINAQQYEKAQAAMETYLHNFPEDDFMRKMLAIAQQP